MKTLHTSNRYLAQNDEFLGDSEFQSFDEINIKEIDSIDFDRDILEMPSDMYGDIY